MLLKRLEMNGFKSFADKIGIDFVQGTTAIVGPNGSGKSNITEAIRWVLGEHSAKSLRGGRMGDVIFAGSETRKPLNFAEVSLILENEERFLPLDYSEVSITRRIYRNGDSEFLINKQTCRLKDIVDLFMDSGLGRESFSIISQGKIDEILNSKPEERRTIFEEAAGVLKYKQRKKQAENKLFETEENLTRVQDILHELKDQMEPLEMQASVAKDYLYQKGELEKYEIHLLTAEIEEISALLLKEQALFDQNNKRLDDLRKVIETEEKQITTQKNNLRETESTLEDLQQKLLLETEKLEQLEGERNLVLERKKHRTENEKSLNDTYAALSAKIQELELQKEQFLAKKHKKEIALEMSKKEKQVVEEKLARYDDLSEEKIENRKSDYIELRHSQTTLNNDIGYIRRHLDQLSHKLEKLNQENSAHITKRSDLIKSIENIDLALKEVKAEIKAQVDHYHKTKDRVAEKSTAFEKATQNLYKHYEKIQQAKSRHETLAELSEDYAGFFQGVKEVLKAKNQLSGILGAVVELIDIPQRYQKALEIALGANAQNVITTDEKSAQLAIQFLKKTRSGRATFLPLATIRPREIPSDIKSLLEKESAFIALASEVIYFEPKIKPAILNMLGATILAQDLKGANIIAQLIRHRYRVVTLDGDIVNVGGSMSGGMVKEGTASVISRKNEIGQLEETIRKLSLQTEKFEQSVKKAKEDLQQKQIELEEARFTGENLRLREQELRSKQAQKQKDLTGLNKQLELYDLEKEEGLNEQIEQQARLEELEAKNKQMKEQMMQIDAEITQMTSTSKALESKLKADEKTLSSLRVQIAAEKEQLQSAINDVDRLEKLLSNYYEEKEQIKKRQEALQTNLSNACLNEEETTQQIEKSRQNKQNIICQLDEFRKKRANMKNKLASFEHHLVQKNNEASYYLEQRNKAEINIGKVEVDLKNRAIYLKETYGLTPEEGATKKRLDLDTEDALSKVRLLKRSIAELGTVNLGAIEEFERVSERYTFLFSQQDDLLTAKETLFQVMEEMEEEIKKRFSESFAAIQKEFALVFPELFGGGSAELILVNPDNLLTTGIDIIVQPPGKKLQNLSLRSGGERALTAIALLFAIIRIRPVPFCILDEVEAALDEANVIRFSRYLKKFEKDIQFIVITHRKGTMEEADVLYGVTMQESGVSKLVSVRLEETPRLLK